MAACYNRRAELRSHYKFECRCQPCVENWPTVQVEPELIFSHKGLYFGNSLQRKYGNKVKREIERRRVEEC
jgi:hypothetical protein